MFLILGVRGRVKNLATVLLLCGYCHTPAANRLLRVERWFTLFFLPVFPISRQHKLTCTMCGSVTSLSKADAEHYVDMAGQQASLPPFGQPQQPFPPYPSPAYPPATTPYPPSMALEPSMANHPASAPLPPMPSSGPVTMPGSSDGNWPRPAPTTFTPPARETVTD
ncbi:MAG TPA: zinc-ribbon domain-containing protein [Acidimicrobiales bacterium]|nr:zinc-ribbon domain-containing protein [Acidimicrobiales bacterium]